MNAAQVMVAGAVAHPAATTWVTEGILSASEHIGDERAVLWMSDN